MATCTPQTAIRLDDGAPYRTWHEQFQDSFRRAASDPDLPRHHQAAFVLSNFLAHDGGDGGLSGVFMPVEGPLHTFPTEVFTSGWGRPKSKEPGPNRWSTPDEGQDVLKTWQSRGFIAVLNPFSPAAAAVRIFGFTLQRLPRDNSRWDKPAGLTGVRVQVGRRDGDGPISFERVELRDA